MNTPPPRRTRTSYGGFVLGTAVLRLIAVSPVDTVSFACFVKQVQLVYDIVDLEDQSVKAEKSIP